MQLRAMNIIYETTKERGTTILIPSSMVDAMNPGLAVALAGRTQGRSEPDPQHPVVHPGGVHLRLAWLLGGLLLAITIVGLPWAGAAWRIGMFAFAPFGRQVIDRHAATGRPDLGTGPLGLILNVVWFLVAGWWIALHHVIIGAAQFVTIIGIPFAWQHFKLAFIALAPVGKTIVEG